MQELAEQYRQSCKVIRKCLRRANEYDRPHLQSALIECNTLASLTDNYYERDYRPPRAYSMSQCHNRSPKFTFSYAVESRIIDAVHKGVSALDELGL